MMHAPKPQMRWLSIVALGLLIAGVVAWRNSQNRPDQPPAAYVLPLENAKLGWLVTSRALEGPEVILDGKTLSVVEGKVRVLSRDGSPVDLSAGSEQVFAARSTSEASILWSSLELLEKWRREGSLSVGGKVAVRSPVGVTRFTNPMIDWVAEEGRLYDVAVIDTEDPLAKPRLTERVRPPITLDALSTTERRMLLPGRIYEVFVREHGKQESLGAGRVLISSEAKMGTVDTKPADLMTDAFMALRDRPYRTGDAYLAWNALPSEWQTSEPGQRLRLALAAEYGESDQIEAILSSGLKKR